jgi:hypothetical protein
VAKAWLRNEVRSGGLWGIESDSDSDYLSSVAREEVSELCRVLRSLGFSARAVTRAVAAEGRRLAEVVLA